MASERELLKMLIDRRSAVEQRAQSAKRSKRNEEEYGRYFEDLIQPSVMMTVTYAGLRPPGRKIALRQIQEMLGEVEVKLGRSMVWVAALDYGSTGRLHFHILVGNVDGLSRKRLFEMVHSRFGRVRIVRFEPGRGGAEYVARNGLSPFRGFRVRGQVAQAPHRTNRRSGEPVLFPPSGVRKKQSWGVTVVERTERGNGSPYDLH
jgi:hypothetical protein